MASDAGGGIAVIIPLYNGGRYIATALQSVLNQTRSAHEIIVVDDGSSDAGPAIVESMMASGPIRLLRQTNAGQSAARNRGVAATNCRLLAFLDHDDVWYPDHLEALASALAAGAPDAAWAYSNLDLIDETGAIQSKDCLRLTRTPHPKRTVEDCLGADMFVLPSASLVSRAAFEAVGGFDVDLRGYEDDDFFLRLMLAGFGHRYVARALGQWRQVSTSSSRSPRMAESRLRYFAKLRSRFPDAEGHRSLIRSLIAPRFYGNLRDELVAAVQAGHREKAVVVGRGLRSVAAFLAPAQRHRLALALPFVTSYRLMRTVHHLHFALGNLAAQILPPDVREASS